MEKRDRKGKRSRTRTRLSGESRGETTRVEKRSNGGSLDTGICVRCSVLRGRDRSGVGERTRGLGA